MGKLQGLKAKAQQTNNYTQDSYFLPRKAAIGRIWTQDTLQSRQVLYQLSYQGNSAGRGSDNTMLDCGEVSFSVYSFGAHVYVGK